MPKPPAVKTLSEEFARNLNEVLTATAVVWRGRPRLKARYIAQDRLAVISSGRGSLSWDSIIPLGTDDTPRVGLNIFASGVMDRDNKYLMITQSAFSLYSLVGDCFGEGRPGRSELIFGIDYAREPMNDYPVCHIHVGGGRDDLDRLYRGDRKRRELPQLHFPVGGRRFRPTLEDVIEFAIVEELAEPVDGWRDAIKRTRDDYEINQTRAAARNHQHEVAEVLDDAGWTVTPPPAES